MIDWLVDGLLVLAILTTAIATLWSRHLFRAVVMFIAFGLLMALAWVRLRAPDIALAEAAIGAGLTGVLLLDAARHLGSRGMGTDGQEDRPK
ncbi:MAG TPA: hydrogenase subunit MbhD domain-containing protein [Marinobacter sp.]|nr:hydrogenase subunit MbhD domain-containing protein [Marinobacter sp.]